MITSDGLRRIDNLGLTKDNAWNSYLYARLKGYSKSYKMFVIEKLRNYLQCSDHVASGIYYSRFYKVE